MQCRPGLTPLWSTGGWTLLVAMPGRGRIRHLLRITAVFCMFEYLEMFTKIGLLAIFLKLEYCCAYQVLHFSVVVKVLVFFISLLPVWQCLCVKSPMSFLAETYGIFRT